MGGKAPCARGAASGTLSGFMPWIVASLVSAFFLGCYDLCTKHAVRENAVLPVLFITNVCSTVVWLTLMLVARIAPNAIPAELHVDGLTLFQHAQLLLKSAI